MMWQTRLAQSCQEQAGGNFVASVAIPVLAAEEIFLLDHLDQHTCK
jgi:hypothetical protein